MHTITKYRTLFNEKLAKTDNMDEAFIKAVWIAYLDGAEGRAFGDPKPVEKDENVPV